MGVPGWPEFACSTASMASVRIVLTASVSSGDASDVRGMGFPLVEEFEGGMVADRREESHTAAAPVDGARLAAYDPAVAALPETLPPGDEIERLAGRVRALLRAGDDAGALALLDGEVARAPTCAAVLAMRGHVRFFAWDFEGAKADLTRALEIDRRDGGIEAKRRMRAHAMLGVSLDRLGDRDTFDRWTRECVEDIPAPIREKMGAIHVEVRDYPEPSDTARRRGTPMTLGLFRGVPFPKRARAAPADTTILIFQRPHELMARDKDDLRALLWETVAHELGHFLGLEEREVRALGL